MDVGRNFLPSPLGLDLSTTHGVIFVPQAWLVAVTSWNVIRAPLPSPAKRKPREFCRPASAASASPSRSALNQPKNAPLDPAVAVIANVPDALSLSFNVFGVIVAAYDAGVEQRQIFPPISPFALPATFVSR